LVTDASRLDGRSQDAAQVAEKTYALDERFIDGNANSIKKERLAILDSYGQVSKGATGNAALGISYEESTRLELDPQQDPRATSIKGNSLLSPSINMLDRFGETMVHTRGGQIIPDSLQNNTLNQIIERAVLHLKSGQPEIKIDLKPEFLGHLRMLVSTENHQVAIRMMTEVPLAKEIIENNINHLKAELQNHGLQIDKFDVFVSQDSDQSGGEDKNGHLFGMEDGSFCDEELDATLVEEIGETIQSVEERDEVNLINLFA
ncbi:MAG: flagellar hook-length control protein FliK, partial [Thermodesulfobacteriota bacterium]|nr:flagellar hook-length control protein FliK [Thermodesulfobacteriota bacterium]